MAFAKLNSMKFVGLDGLSHFWSKAKAYTDTVCCNTITRDTLCLACSYACTNTKASCACTYAVSCIGTMSALCTTCAKAYTDTLCCNTITRDTLCLACSYACTNTKSLCACTYAGSIGTSCKNAACSFTVTCSNNIGTACKNAACSFAVSCGHAIGTACKNAATATKANCYGNSYNCVQCSHIAKNIFTNAYTSAEQRYIYIGNPTDMSGNIGCNANLWFCPTCNVLAMGGSCGATICLVSEGSDSMAGDRTKLNPKIVFDTMDDQRGCLQYSQYDTVHPGAGLCWSTNQGSTWFDTDNIYANTLTIRNNSLRLGSYCIYIG